MERTTVYVQVEAKINDTIDGDSRLEMVMRLV